MTDSNVTPIHIRIYKNARQINRMHTLIKTTFAKRNKNKPSYDAWQQACTDFRERYENLVFSCDGYVGEDGLVELLTNDDANGVFAREFAICFIEIRPYYFRSGYLYSKLLRKLKYAPLTPDQNNRYEEIRTKYRLYRQNRLNEKFISS